MAFMRRITYESTRSASCYMIQALAGERNTRYIGESRNSRLVLLDVRFGAC